MQCNNYRSSGTSGTNSRAVCYRVVLTSACALTGRFLCLFPLLPLFLVFHRKTTPLPPPAWTRPQTPPPIKLLLLFCPCEKCLRHTSMECKQRSSTVSNKASPLFELFGPEGLRLSETSVRRKLLPNTISNFGVFFALRRSSSMNFSDPLNDALSLEILGKFGAFFVRNFIWRKFKGQHD